MNSTPTTDHFTHEAANALPPLLGKGDPAPYTLVKGNSPVIILGPHNGSYIPKSLYDKNNLPLGLPENWFSPNSGRHEAQDIGMSKLFEALQNGTYGKDFNYLSSPYSRLICDLSRARRNAVTQTSSEDEAEKIPGNINLTEEQREQRLQTLYDPYQNAIKKLIKETREKCGHIVALDLHSFSPTWNGKSREVDIGTLALADNPMENELVKRLSETCDASDLIFAKNEPYNMARWDAERTEAAEFIEKCGAWYMGIEIRNDHLKTSESTSGTGE